MDGKPLASCFQDRLFGPLGLKDTLLPAITSNTLPEPYSHGYLYGGCSFSNLTDKPYPPELQAAARPEPSSPTTAQARTLPTPRRPEASSRPPTISPHGSRQLVGGKVLNADYQRQWLDSLQPEVPSKPEGQKYGYGISQISWGPNTIYFHGGEMPGFNSKISYDPTNQLTLIIWTNLTVSLDGQQTANTLFVKMLDQIYVLSPLSPSASPTKSTVKGAQL
jgi:Beta-lactamase class C and other penicillin binding proteins